MDKKTLRKFKQIYKDIKDKNISNVRFDVIKHAKEMDKDIYGLKEEIENLFDNIRQEGAGIVFIIPIYKFIRIINNQKLHVRIWKWSRKNVNLNLILPSAIGIIAIIVSIVIYIITKNNV